MKITTVKMGPMKNNCYIVTDEKTGDTAVIDPSFKSHILAKEIEPLKDQIKYILLTHRHFDHLLGAAYIRELTGAKAAIHRLDKEGLSDPDISRATKSGGMPPDAQKCFDADILLEDGGVLTMGETVITAMHTPGHTEGSVCYIIGDSLFSGDTLFRECIGRCDLPTGNFERMKESLAKIKALPVTNIYPGHEEATTLDHELKYNTYM